VDYNGFMNILESLNSKQKEAIKITSGPVLVVAGPGSGKTKTLTHRIAYLIAKGVRPYNILAVTFTNKAADEMKSRVTKLLETSSYNSQPTIGTFHSVCARILRKEAHAIGHTSNFTIYDEEDALKLIKNILREASLDQKQFNPAKIRSIISSLKDKLVTPDDHGVEVDNQFAQETNNAYHAYQKQLKSQNALDFDDLLMKTVELFEENPKILQKYQAQFKHVLIDEFQDTNLSQYKIAHLLSQKHKNIYCIGDLDQSIYSFRGADYRNILHFEKDWPEVKIIILEQNYRSTQNILDVADSIISHNKLRVSLEGVAHKVKKNLWTENGVGDLIVLKETEDEAGEGEFIISEIEKLVRKQGLRLRDFVVLYRTNAQSRAIEESFLRNSFPYKIVGGIKFYQRKEIKDMLAWLRLCINPDDVMAMNRISGIPAKFFNVKCKIKSKIQSSKSKAQKINLLIEIFTEKSKKYKITKLLEYIIKNTGFADYLRDGTEKGEERWDNVRELLSVASKYEGEQPQDAARLLIEEASLAQETDGIEYEKDVVNLMTLHSAKGLEFPVIFIAGCEQGLLPHSRALFGTNDDELEEERRLFYVGITRAKEKAYLLFTQTRMLFGKIQSNPPSEFLQNIPEHLIEFISAEEEERIIELD